MLDEESSGKPDRAVEAKKPDFFTRIPELLWKWPIPWHADTYMRHNKVAHKSVTDLLFQNSHLQTFSSIVWLSDQDKQWKMQFAAKCSFSIDKNMNIYQWFVHVWLFLSLLFVFLRVFLFLSTKTMIVSLYSENWERTVHRQMMFFFFTLVLKK